MTSYFKPKVELYPFYACAVTNIQYNHRYLQSNCLNLRLLQEIVKEPDGDVILYTGLGYGADSAERIASY